MLLPFVAAVAAVTVAAAVAAAVVVVVVVVAAMTKFATTNIKMACTMVNLSRLVIES